MSMSNPYLVRVNYTPEEEPPPVAATAPSPFQAATAPSAVPVATAPPAIQAVISPPATQRLQSRLSGLNVTLYAFVGFLLAATVTELIGEGGKEVIGKVWNWFQQAAVPAPIQVPLGPLAGVEVERYGSLEAAINRNPPDRIATIKDWNEPGTRRFEISSGDLSLDSLPVYAPELRRGFEQSFEELGDGLSRVRLYSINVPDSWSPGIVEDRRYKWAKWCRVEPEWIDLWSSFRDGKLSRTRVNECRPGGRCLIVSPECNRRIFDTLERE